VSWARFFTAAQEPGAPPPLFWTRVFNFSIALLLMAVVFCFSFQRLAYHLQWSSVYGYRRVFLQGWLTTLWISAASLVFSVLIGLIFALAQGSRVLIVRYFAKVYIEGVRGTPLLVQLLIFFYVVANAFNITDRYWVGILTLSFFSGAYISEIFRAGIESVAGSQLESARAVGFTRAQIYRYVIFPQAVRQSLPPLAGQLVSLIKDSSLLSIIGITEFTYNAQNVNARTYSTLESYIPLAIGYLILTLPISLWTRRLERRLRYET